MARHRLPGMYRCGETFNLMTPQGFAAAQWLREPSGAYVLRPLDALKKALKPRSASLGLVRRLNRSGTWVAERHRRSGPVGLGEFPSKVQAQKALIQTVDKSAFDPLPCHLLDQALKAVGTDPHQEAPGFFPDEEIHELMDRWSYALDQAAYALRTLQNSQRLYSYSQIEPILDPLLDIVMINNIIKAERLFDLPHPISTRLWQLRVATRSFTVFVRSRALPRLTSSTTSGSGSSIRPPADELHQMVAVGVMIALASRPAVG